MVIRAIQSQDASEWLRMRQLLWPDEIETHAAEIQAFFAQLNPDLETFVCDRTPDAPETSQLGGFVEIGIRSYAEGCDSDRVAYIEGWYVDADLRRQGIGRQLIQAAEQWARSQHLTEMASDCLLDNQISYAAHLDSGFEAVERLIVFRKRLAPDSYFHLH